MVLPAEHITLLLSPQKTENYIFLQCSSLLHQYSTGFGYLPSRNFSSQLFKVWNVITSRYKHHNTWLNSHIWECSPQEHLQLQEQTMLDQSSNDLVNNKVSGYFATFVCWATKATCFATMTSITTDTFIAAFRHCITPQGKPRPIYSHTGTKFQGAASQLFIFHTNTTFRWPARSRSTFHEVPLEVYVWKSDKLTKSTQVLCKKQKLVKILDFCVLYPMISRRFLSVT